MDNWQDVSDSRLKWLFRRRSLEVKVDEAEEEVAARREDRDAYRADSTDYSNLSPMVSVPIYYKILFGEIDFETVGSMMTNVNGWGFFDDET